MPAGREDRARTRAQAMSAEAGVSDVEGGPPSGTKLWEMEAQTLRLFSINLEIPEGGCWPVAIHVDGRPCSLTRRTVLLIFPRSAQGRNRRDVHPTSRATDWRGVTNIVSSQKRSG